MIYSQRRKHNKIKIIVLLMALIGFSLFALTQGSVKIPVFNVLEILKTHAENEGIKASHIFIVREVRLPRIILAAFVGGTLSVIGAAFQAIFKNPMADPYVMGISSGAAFGATLGIVFGLGQSILGMSAVSSMAFIGALVTMLVVYTLAQVGGRVSTTGILLSGIVINAFLSAMISLMMLMFHTEIDKIVIWTMGSFNASSWDHVKLMILPMTFGLIYILSLSRELNAMVVSEDDAKNIGVDVERLKKRTLIISSFLAAFAVSVSGIIGFVGLIVPHFFRMLFGSDHRLLMPVSFLGGALFLLFCDTLARSMVSNMEIPVGIITAIFGGPFFLILLHKHKKKLL